MTSQITQSKLSEGFYWFRKEVAVPLFELPLPKGSGFLIHRGNYHSLSKGLTSRGSHGSTTKRCRV